MTSIGTPSYATGYGMASSLLAPLTPASTATANGAETADSSSGSTVTVTLSDAAKAAMKAQADTPTLASVTAAALTTIGQLLTAAGATDAISDGQATIDMSGLDRRSLFAVADNANGAFTANEQAVASATMTTNFQNALAGPTAAARVTGDYAAIYKAAQDDLAKAGPEEKASAAWIQANTVVSKGYQQATTTPGVMPSGLTADPVAAYVTAQDGATPTTTLRDIQAVASDVRTALNAQYASATASGAATGANSGAIDFSSLDDRSLASIALNEGGQFSSHEILAAKTEVRSRSASSAIAGYSQSGGSFSGDLISRYTSMSPEERQAQGWTPELYANLVQNYRLSQTLGGMSGGASGGSVLAGLSTATGSTASAVLDLLT